MTDTTAKAYMDLAHTERLAYDAKIAQLERMCAWHVSMRQSQEKFIQALFSNCQYLEASNYWWQQAAEMSMTDLSDLLKELSELDAAS